MSKDNDKRGPPPWLAIILILIFLGWWLIFAFLSGWNVPTAPYKAG